jgi:hypothetical protein
MDAMISAKDKEIDRACSHIDMLNETSNADADADAEAAAADAAADDDVNADADADLDGDGNVDVGEGAMIAPVWTPALTLTSAPTMSPHCRFGRSGSTGDVGAEAYPSDQPQEHPQRNGFVRIIPESEDSSNDDDEDAQSSAPTPYTLELTASAATPPLPDLKTLEEQDRTHQSGGVGTHNRAGADVIYMTPEPYDDDEDENEEEDQDASGHSSVAVSPWSTLTPTATQTLARSSAQAPSNVRGATLAIQIQHPTAGRSNTCHTNPTHGPNRTT